MTTSCIVEIKDHSQSYDQITRRQTAGVKTGATMIDAAGNLAKIEVSFSRFVVKVINPGWRGKQVCVLENVTEFLPVEQVLTIIPAPPVIPAMPPIVMQPSPENFGEVVISTDHKGRCVAVTRQDDDGHVIKTIWMKKKKKDK